MIGAGPYYWMRRELLEMWRSAVDTEAAPVKKTLAELAKDLDEARVAFEEADKQYNQASRTRSDRLNYLNHAQGSLEQAMLDLRKSAPTESNWGRVNNERNRRDG